MPNPQEINSWSEFKSQAGSLPKKGKGDAFESFVHAYLKLDPQYTTLLKDVWLLQNVPADVRTHLNLPDRDEGIDLIARTYEGTFWAIQCKYVEDEDHSLTRKALSTFTDLAFTVCRNIDYALICTTADRFSHKLALYGERLGFLAGDIWRNLDDEFFQRLNQHLQGKSARIEPRLPRPHQQRAIDNAESHFVTEGNSRGKLILPCGTGKSLTGYWIAERLNARTILVAVPSLSLVRQTLKEWLRESVAKEHDVHWMAVCSDESVAEQKSEDTQEIKLFTQDLGIRVHTNPQEIAAWLKRRQDGLTVVFTTYQSGRATSEAARLAGITFDLAIMDEAHKTVGKKDSLFSHLLFDKNLPVRHRVFMTATERRYLGDSDRIASMTDPDLYGETFELLTFKEALEADPPILSDYRIVTIVVTRQEIKQLVQENLFVRPDQGRWDDDVEAEMLAAAIALRKAIQKHPIRHAVSFHSSISRANVFKSTQDALTKTFPDFGHLETFHVSGNTPTAKRSRELERFVAASPSLVTNARCLTEGVDVPGIDCVLFADPKRSTVDIVQAVGRALRRAEGKEFGYVVVPVLIDEGLGDDPDAQYEAFAPVLTVLRSLAGNDERIVEYFRSVSEGRKGSGRDRGEIIDIPVGVFVDANAFVESIELKLWSRLAKLSWRPFEEARSYVQGLGLKSRSDWENFCKGAMSEKGILPADIPTAVNVIYKNCGWQSWGDWLGTGLVATYLKVYRPFGEARTFARGLELKNGDEWNDFCKGKLYKKGVLPEDIPLTPAQVYKHRGWRSMGDWLGTGNIANYHKVYRPFEEAREFAKSLCLTSSDDWRRYIKGELQGRNIIQPDIPANPNQVYKKKGWRSWGDWLGTERVADRLKVYLDFEDARDFARSLKLVNSDEWSEFCKGNLPEKGFLPHDVPAIPRNTYKNKGWISFGDWLGTGTVAGFLKVYRPFEEAREFARCLGLKRQKDWIAFCKGELPEKGSLPEDIPAKPDGTYKNKGWLSFGDWLGTGRTASFLIKYRPFEEARVFAQGLGLKSQEEWTAFCRGEFLNLGALPKDIPATPRLVYKDKGWISSGDWLGTGIVATYLKTYRSFETARDFVRTLELKNKHEWRNFCKGSLPEKGSIPEDIPANPYTVYKEKGWNGFIDWLGVNKSQQRINKYRSFEKARQFSRSLNLKSRTEWDCFCRGKFSEKGYLPKDIPAHPERIYKGFGWISVGDWLGTGAIAKHLKTYRTFPEARTFVCSLGLKNLSEWREYCKGNLYEIGVKPDDIPSNPGATYKDKGWNGIGDWLGTGNIAKFLRVYKNFEDARTFARNLRLKNIYEWREFCKGNISQKGSLPYDVPASPHHIYKGKGWAGYMNWLGARDE